MGKNKLEAWQLKQRQSISLDGKILFSVKRIKEFVNYFGEENVYVSFSGGKDSTVLLDIVRRKAGFPNIRAVFSDTGLEYPEIREFVKTVENVEWVKPKISFYDVIKKYGYPVVSKKIATLIHECQTAKNKNTNTYVLRTTGYTSNGRYNPLGKISNKWQFLIDAPFKISGVCCKHLKKQPLSNIKGYPIIGTMASESRTRLLTYLKDGCNSFNPKATTPSSKPISIWLDDDIWNYIKQEGIKYSKIYDMGYERTGCMFCPFGLGMDKIPNRFHRMKITHPQLYKYCMEKLGFEEVLKYVYGEHILDTDIKFINNKIVKIGRELEW